MVQKWSHATCFCREQQSASRDCILLKTTVFQAEYGSAAKNTWCLKQDRQSLQHVLRIKRSAAYWILIQTTLQDWYSETARPSRCRRATHVRATHPLPSTTEIYISPSHPSPAPVPSFGKTEKPPPSNWTAPSATSPSVPHPDPLRTGIGLFVIISKLYYLQAVLQAVKDNFKQNLHFAYLHPFFYSAWPEYWT